MDEFYIVKIEKPALSHAYMSAISMINYEFERAFEFTKNVKVTWSMEHMVLQLA